MSPLRDQVPEATAACEAAELKMQVDVPSTQPSGATTLSASPGRQSGEGPRVLASPSPSHRRTGGRSKSPTLAVKLSPTRRSVGDEAALLHVDTHDQDRDDDSDPSSSQDRGKPVGSPAEHALGGWKEVRRDGVRLLLSHG